MIKYVALGIQLALLSALASRSALADDKPVIDERFRHAISLASAIDRAVFEKIATQARTPTRDDLGEPTLSALLMLHKIAPPQDSDPEKSQFRYLTKGFPKPAMLAKEMYRSLGGGNLRFVYRPVTMIQSERITRCEAKVEGDSAQGSFDFHVPGLYEGNADFVAKRQDDAWEVVEFEMATLGIHVAKGDDGKWQKIPGQPRQFPIRWIAVRKVAADDRQATSSLTHNDVKQIVATVPTIKRRALAKHAQMVAKVGAQEIDLQIAAVTPDTFSMLQDALDQQMLRGRFITDRDLAAQAPVAVLAQSVADKLFANQDPIGKQIDVDGTAFTVVGVLSKPKSVASRAQSGECFVPLTMSPWSTTNDLDGAWFRVNQFHELETSQQLIRDVLNKNHPGTQFEIESMSASYE